MNTIPMTIRISPEAKEKLEKICKLEGRSHGKQVEYLINQYKFNDEKEGNRV